MAVAVLLAGAGLAAALFPAKAGAPRFSPGRRAVAGGVPKLGMAWPALTNCRGGRGWRRPGFRSRGAVLRSRG